MSRGEQEGCLLYSNKKHNDISLLKQKERKFVNQYFLWVLFFVLFICITSVAAFGDENRKELSVGEIQHYKQLIESGDSDPIEQALGIEALMSDKRSTIRNFAICSALKSNNYFIKSKILEEILYLKQIINIEFLPIENPSEEIKNYLSKHPGVSYKVKFVDRENSCLDLYWGNKCDSGKALDVSGTKVDIRYDEDHATFKLNENNELLGKFYTNRLGGSIPAKIIIY